MALPKGWINWNNSSVHTPQNHNNLIKEYTKTLMTVYSKNSLYINKIRHPVMSLQYSMAVGFCHTFGGLFFVIDSGCWQPDEISGISETLWSR